MIPPGVASSQGDVSDGLTWGIPTPWSVMSRRSAAFAEDRRSRQSPIVMLM
jgi:hypothetical protein